MQFMLSARCAVAAGAGVVLALASAVAGYAAPAVGTVRVSEAADGTQANANSTSPDITPDGRFVVFGSNATNLVAADTNGVGDLFVRDLKTGAIDLVTRGADGSPANGGSIGPRISADGRFVTFWSSASNLAAGDTNGVDDVFVRDRQTGSTTRLPSGLDFSAFPDINSTGRYVAYSTRSALLRTDFDILSDIYLWDRSTEAVTLLVTGGNGENSSPVLSANGRWVAFMSDSTDLTKDAVASGNNSFVLDRTTGAITLVSRASDGTPASAGSYPQGISDNGRYIVFSSSADNLVTGDANGDTDVFLYDRVTGRTVAASSTPDGRTGDAASYDPDISPDGGYVSYFSLAQNLTGAVLPEWEIHTYLYDRKAGTNTVVSVPPAGAGGGGWASAVSSGGRFVAYESFGDGLVKGDTNDEMDVFITQLY
jgi:Tol biopolymer transport system component